MKPEWYLQAGQLFHEALELEAGQRMAFLEKACAGNEELRREVESLLAADEQAKSLIAVLALEIGARMMAADQAGFSVGRRISRFQIDSLLGAGGMGEVYLARDTQLDRPVALKLLSARFTNQAEHVRRFALEARAASALNHPNIITIHEIGEAEGSLYIVTEYVQGETLCARMMGTPQKRIRLAEALDFATQIAAALAAAHQAGILHRDIKPENVMVRGDGYVKVLDFGLAKLTEPHVPDNTGTSPAASATRPHLIDWRWETVGILTEIEGGITRAHAATGPDARFSAWWQDVKGHMHMR